MVRRFARLCSLAVSLALLGAGCASVGSGSPAQEDGRFTIGVANQRLMYGYPVPYSTSHFVISVDGRFASNTPAFPRDRVEYVHNRVMTEGSGGSQRKIVTYAFSGVVITQRLIPVDSRLEDVAAGGWGQYYRIEYEIDNRTDTARRIGLMLLLDTMIDDNDACQMDADGTRVSVETRFVRPRVPSEVLVWQEPGNNRRLVGALVTDKGRATKPDELFVGGWPAYHNTVWEPTATGSSYFDSALLLKWREESVPARGRRYLATYYGVRGSMSSQIQALTEGSGFRRESATVYFDFGKADLTDEGRSALSALVQAKRPEGAFVEVYTDAVGNAAANLALSRRRAESVRDYLESLGVAEAVIVPKSYGESYADQSAAAATGGKAEDRKAVVVIYSKN